MGQYVTRKDDKTGKLKQFYKADDGYLYPSYEAARNRQTLRTAGSGLNSLLGDPGFYQREMNRQGSVSSTYTALQRRRNPPLIPLTQTPLERAQVGQPMVLNGVLGYKGADGTWQPRGDMESEDIPTYTAKTGYVYDTPSSQPEYRSGYQSQPVAPVQPQYKIYPTTLEGQYERYFKTPELDYVFGAGARQGDEAPKDAAAMQILGNQLTADPESKNIASMYAAQSAMGRVNMPEILKMYEGNKNMQEWARENPMLAQREFLKARAREAADMPVALDQETVVGDLGSRAQGEGGWSYPEKTEAEATAVEEAKAKLLRQAENQRLQAGGFESRTPGLF